MSLPFESAPIEHQQALHDMIFSGTPKNTMSPASESGISTKPMIPTAPTPAPIKEKVKPKLVKSLVHSGIKAPMALGKV